MITLNPLPRVITFDCYGTLVKWHRAVWMAARAILTGRFRAGSEEEQVGALADRLREQAMTEQYRLPYRGYKDVLRSSLRSALAESGYATGADDGEVLLSFLRAIEPHPDVPAALRCLRTRYQLAIISNTDDDLIAGTVAAIGVPFDFVITAQQAKAYKPDRQLFRHAYAVMGVSKQDTIHVGMGQFTDLKVCHDMKIRTVWINRMGEVPNPRWQADAELPDFSKLPRALLPLA